MLERAREGTLKPVIQSNGEATKSVAAKRKGRWDQSTEDTPTVKKPVLSLSTTPSVQATPSWENEVSIQVVSRSNAVMLALNCYL